jgi:hypothetical protein
MLYTIVVIWTGGQERARESNRQDSKQTGKGNTMKISTEFPKTIKNKTTI